MRRDEEAAELIGRIRLAMGPELIELILNASKALPLQWKEWPAELCFEYLRCRLKFTQDELARKSGLTQSQVSRVEGGFDALLSTWRKVYAAMGFELVILPASRHTVEELEKSAEEDRPPGHWRRQRARPRRRWRRPKETDGPEGLSPLQPGA